jgi:hypothetical protein
MKQRTLVSMWSKRKRAQEPEHIIDLTIPEPDSAPEIIELAPKPAVSAQTATGFRPSFKSNRVSKPCKLELDEMPFPPRGQSHIGWESQPTVHDPAASVLRVDTLEFTVQSSTSPQFSYSDNDDDTSHSWPMTLIDASVIVNNQKSDRDLNDAPVETSELGEPFSDQNVDVFMRSKDAQIIAEALCRMDVELKSRFPLHEALADDSELKPARMRNRMERVLRQRARAVSHSYRTIAL